MKDLNSFRFSIHSKCEVWEYYLRYPSQTLFLDIETEGLSKERNHITVIGIFYQNKYFPFVKGKNLYYAEKILEKVPIWVTFAGTNFDIPFVKKLFPHVKNPLIHIDIFPLSAKIGLRGGLKKIEKTLGIARETEGMTGYDAVKLWQKWEKKKDKEALRKLLLYNKEDVKNLKILLEIIISKLNKNCLKND